MLTDSTDGLFKNASDFLRNLWDFELFRSGDSIVVFNQVLIAVVVVLVGFVVSKWLARALGRRLAKMGKLNENTMHVLQRLFFLFFVVVVVLIALPIAGIPITIFTVLGGALAIGVGFGAQNLFNNLISGLILMIEKPIRIGDIIDLGDSQGKVQDIGNRCVRMRRGDGVDVLVPNSHFLEQNVVNWTLSDADLRGQVTVGVAYGSETRKVHDLMMQATKEQPKIHDSPEPFILFEDFGDNSLVFRLYYWSAVAQPMDLGRINSAIRFRIDELFREAGITISFPQRDVHLDTLKPLQIDIVDQRPDASRKPNL